jgi:hypothetical protein
MRFGRGAAPPPRCRASASIPQPPRSPRPHPTTAASQRSASLFQHHTSAREVHAVRCRAVMWRLVLLGDSLILGSRGRAPLQTAGCSWRGPGQPACPVLSVLSVTPQTLEGGPNNLNGTPGLAPLIRADQPETERPQSLADCPAANMGGLSYRWAGRVRRRVPSWAAGVLPPPRSRMGAHPRLLGCGRRPSCPALLPSTCSVS